MKPKTALVIILWMLVGVFLVLFYKSNQPSLSAEIGWGSLKVTVAQAWFLSAALLSTLIALFFGMKRIGLNRALRQSQKRLQVMEQEYHDVFEVQQKMELGLFEQALEDLAKNAKGPQSTLLKGQCLFALGQKEEAIAELKAAFEQDRVNAGLLLVKALKDQGQDDKLCQILDFGLERYPQSAMLAEARLELAEKKGDWDGAIKVRDKFLKAGGTLALDRAGVFEFELLRSKFKVSEFVRKDLDQLKNLVKNHPEFIPAQILLAEYFFENNDPKRALTTLEQGYSQTRHVEFLHRLEHFYLEQGRPEDVLQVYRQDLASKEDPVVRFKLGQLLHKLEMHDEAISILETLANSYGSVALVANLLASCFVKRGQYEQAFKTLRGALKDNKEFEAAFQCNRCHGHHHKWAGRCGKCGAWNSVNHTMSFSEKSMPAQRPIYY